MVRQMGYWGVLCLHGRSFEVMIATMDNHSDRHRHSGARTCFSFLFTHASSTNIIVDEAYRHTNESCKIVTIPMRALKFKKLLFPYSCFFDTCAYVVLIVRHLACCDCVLINVLSSSSSSSSGVGMEPSKTISKFYDATDCPCCSHRTCLRF